MAGEITIPVSGPARVRVNGRSGKVLLEAMAREDILLPGTGAEAVSEERDADGVVTLTPGGRGSRKLHAQLPLGAELTVGTASGAVELRGKFGTVRVTTASGSILVEHAERADLRSEHGSVELGHCGGRCRIQTRSGKARVDDTERAEIATVSGKVDLKHAGGPVVVRSVSGKVDVGAEGHSDIAVQTMSGSVTVSLPADARPDARLRSLSGKRSCELEEGHDCTVAVETLSGKIEVVPR